MNNSKNYAVHIQGITPLIMNSDKCCNPLNSLSKKIKELTGLRKKTDEHHIAIQRLEFESRMYHTEDLGIYMPCKCLIGCIHAAAKKYKMGKLIKAIFFDEAVGYPLLPYHGKTIDQLYEEKNSKGDNPYIFSENVVVGLARIVRTRPIFNKWEVKFSLMLDVEILPEKDLRMILDTAGREYGLGDLRPQMATGSYGKFKVKDFNEI